LVRKILRKIPVDLIQQDLEKYRLKALELGATEAKIITTDMVLIDERVRGKCIYPKCSFYGTNANCPPYTIDLEQTRKIVENYQYAIFTRLKVPSEEISGSEARVRKLPVKSQIKNHEIVSKIEAEAFFDGYHLAMAFADGPCKTAFCPNNECTALLPGQACRHSLKARAAMEVVVMDAFTMATNVGWDIYPIGVNLPPSEVPFGTKLGLVLIY